MSAFCIRLKKRQRTENWSEDERNLLVKLIKERISIIDNKSTDTTTNLRKSEAWKQIWKRFVAENSRPRAVHNLKNQWRKLKCQKKLQNRKQANAEDDIDNYHENQSKDPLSHDMTASPESVEQNGMCSSDNFKKPSKVKYVITQSDHPQKGGVEYKKSLLELNKLVKEQLTNCALEEHTVKMRQMIEEHSLKIKTMAELHAIECENKKMETEAHVLDCENKRLEGQVLKLDIEIKKKQLNDFST